VLHAQLAHVAEGLVERDQPLAVEEGLMSSTMSPGSTERLAGVWAGLTSAPG